MVAEILRTSVRQFRLGMEGAGSASLVKLVDALLNLLAAPERSQLSTRLLPLLKDIIAAQQRGDYLYIADILEYEILPDLKQE
jgi:hypothetical protein